MADELKTDGQEITDPKGDETKVTISQEKLDSLINEKFKKGAEKANAQLLEALGVDSIDTAKAILKEKAEADEASKSELEKATETINTLNRTLEELQGKLSTVETDRKLASLAAEHGIKEVDYFKYEYDKASKAEDFDEKAFIGTLLETKGGLLTGDKSVNIDNPKNINNNHELPTITMSEYAKLGASDRVKYKASQITKG